MSFISSSASRLHKPKLPSILKCSRLSLQSSREIDIPNSMCGTSFGFLIFLVLKDENNFASADSGGYALCRLLRSKPGHRGH